MPNILYNRTFNTHRLEHVCHLFECASSSVVGYSICFIVPFSSTCAMCVYISAEDKDLHLKMSSLMSRSLLWKSSGSLFVEVNVMENPGIQCSFLVQTMKDTQ